MSHQCPCLNMSVSPETRPVCLAWMEFWETYWLTDWFVSSNCSHQSPYSKISKKCAKCLLKGSSNVLTLWALSVWAFEVQFPGGCSVCFCECVWVLKIFCWSTLWGPATSERTGEVPGEHMGTDWLGEWASPGEVKPRAGCLKVLTPKPLCDFLEFI